MLSKLKGAAKGIATTNALKVKKIEDMFSIKENRKNAKAETKKVETQADIQRYKAHLRMLNLKVNPGETRRDEGRSDELEFCSRSRSR